MMVEIVNIWGGGLNVTWLQCRDWNRPSFWVGIQNGLDSVDEPKYLRFFGRGINIKFILEGGSNLTCFQWRVKIRNFCGRSNWPRFPNGWAKSARFQCQGLNFTWFQCLDGSWPGFCVVIEITWLKWIENHLFFVSGYRIDLIFEWGASWLDLCGGVEVYLIFVRGIEFDFVLVLILRLTCFLCGRSILSTRLKDVRASVISQRRLRSALF